MIRYLTIENFLIKKTLFLFIIYLNLFLPFSYVFGYHDTIDYLSYSNSFPRFEILYPSEWKILYLSNQQTWLLTSRFEVSFGLPEELVYATISIEPTNLSLREYSQRMIDNIAEVIQGKVFPNSNNISISDYPANQVTAKWLDNHFNKEMDVVHIWTVNDGMVYRFAFYSPSDKSDYTNYPPIMDSVIENMTKSFRLIN